MDVAWNGFDNRECDEFKAATEHVGWLAHKGGVRGALRKDKLDALILPTCVTKYSSSWWVPDHHNSSEVLSKGHRNQNVRARRPDQTWAKFAVSGNFNHIFAKVC